MHDHIFIIDFGSQYTQLIARRIRELNIYCEIHPYNRIPDLQKDTKGIILSGSPYSVHEEHSPRIPLESLYNRVPVLGICYGAQLIAETFSGTVARASKREYGKAIMHSVAENNRLFNQVSASSQVWMSHADSVASLPPAFEVIARTDSIPIAGFQNSNGQFPNPVFGIQFHPEVTHSVEGKQILKNFALDICGCQPTWTPDSFAESTIRQLQTTLADDHVILGLSGGVDSTVAGMLIHHAIGKQLICLFIDNGLLRKHEYEEVLESYRDMGLNVIGVPAQEAFLTPLVGVSDPEQKRKIIGETFIRVFEKEARKLSDTLPEGVSIQWFAQGTIYPDVIESISVHGPSATIKSHHNVGGLPEKMHLKIVEPLKFLFKDEVRRVGKALKITDKILDRHPFPGPGLAIRILGDVTAEKVRILQEADAIFIDQLRKHQLYHETWQAGVMLLPVQSVGVMGDERTYENVVALRAVTSLDGMTADWANLPYDFLAEVSNAIINNIKGINRVVYDISSKPPATIEWE